MNQLGKSKFALLKSVLVVAFFLGSGFLYTRSAKADCADGWVCFGTRVSDQANTCTASCTRSGWVQLNQTCDSDCAKEFDSRTCTWRSNRVCGDNCGECGETCGNWYNCSWGCLEYACRCVFPSHVSSCGWRCVEDEFYCAEFGWRDLCRDCDCDFCCWWTNPVCQWGWETLRYNCCIEDDDPPPEPEPECSTNPGVPSLGNPVDDLTTNDTNVVDFDWAANGWGEAACGGRAIRFQIDNDNDWDNGNIYDPGNLSAATTSETVTLNEPEGGYQWRVGAQNENNGWIWSETRSFTLYYIPPTAELMSPANNTIVGINTTQSFQANAIDAVGPMTRMNLERARVTMFGLVDLTELDEPGGDPDESCSGVSCSITREWTPGSADVGQWIVYMKAFDILEAYDGSCTGSPIVPVGWADCGRTGLQDFISIVVTNTTPNVASITGPATLRYGGAAGHTTADYTGLFNLLYSDPNKQEVRTTWSAPNIALEPIDTIRVNVTGIVDGAVPEMRVVIGDPLNSGTRYTACTNSINGAQVINCNLGNVAATSIDIYFSNKIAGSAMELIVDNIELIYTDGSTRLIEAESNDVNGDKVVYDRAILASDPLASPYDGMDTIDGRENMSWIGSLRFPIPLSFSPIPPATLVTLTGTATDSLNDSASATKDITVCGSAPSGGLNNPSPAVDEQDVPRPVTVEWDGPVSWGSTCVAGSNTNTVYYRTKINPVCVAPIPSGGGGYTNYSSVPGCTDVADTGGRQNCLDTVNAFDRNTTYCWFAEANNGEAVTRSDEEVGIVWYFETKDPLDDKDWFTTFGGDIYAGGIEGGAGNALELPDPADYHLTWTPPYLNHIGADGVGTSSLSSLDMDISHNETATSPYFPESESAFFAENAALTSTWPPNYTGNPPADAIDLPRAGIGESCDDIFIHNPPSSNQLTPGEAYAASYSCVQDGLDNYGGDYELQQRGVAAIYVTGNGELRFDAPFDTSDDNPATNMRRIVFITGQNVDVKIDRNLSSPDPADKATLTPLIEAAFVVNGTLEFEGTSGDPLTDPDDSIVVEGPILGKAVMLNRDRGLTNHFPSEIIMYNNYYLYDLTNKERTGVTGINNYTGLFVVDVDWISEE